MLHLPYLLDRMFSQAHASFWTLAGIAPSLTRRSEGMLTKDWWSQSHGDGRTITAVGYGLEARIAKVKWRSSQLDCGLYCSLL